MSTTYKLTSTSASDGAVYLDVPITGVIKSVNFALAMTAGAGGVGQGSAELSRSPVNQIATNNPRGVLAHAVIYTAAASQGASVNSTYPNLAEPIHAGERLYLNCGGLSANTAGLNYTCFFTVF